MIKRLLLMLEFFHREGDQPKYIRHNGFEVQGMQGESKDQWEMIRRPSSEELASVAKQEADRMIALRSQTRCLIRQSVQYLTSGTCQTIKLEQHFSGELTTVQLITTGQMHAQCTHCAVCSERNGLSGEASAYQEKAEQWYSRVWKVDCFLTREQKELLRIPSFE